MKLHTIGLQLNEKRHDYNVYDPNAYGSFWNHKHKNIQMMHVLYKLTLSTSNLPEAVKDVHWCKETVFHFYLIFYLIYIWYFIFKGKESSPIWIIQ